MSSLTYWPTNQMERSFLEGLIVAQLVKKMWVLYGKRLHNADHSNILTEANKAMQVAVSPTNNYKQDLKMCVSLNWPIR